MIEFITGPVFSFIAALSVMTIGTWAMRRAYGSLFWLPVSVLALVAANVALVYLRPNGDEHIAALMVGALTGGIIHMAILWRSKNTQGDLEK